jgi:ATP-dependent Clp protease ATP-binding subunit ClpA
MPYLTDKIQSTQRDERAKRALEAENRSPSNSNASVNAVGLSNARFKLDLGEIETGLRDHIIGQDAAIEVLMQHMKTICVDIGDARKPLASILFTGPTGVGKTEMVRLLARGIYGDADAVCRIDMNTLAQEHYSAALTGAPPGYVGSKEGTTILNQDKIEGTRNLPGIVLFDELEKASNEVVMALLNVLDNGMLTVASGEKTISFRNAIIFMTSNLGAEELNELRSRKAKLLDAFRPKKDGESKHVMMDCLLKRFPPEFINRIDCIETFNWIDGKQIPEILAVEVEKLNTRLAKHGYRLELEPDVEKFLAQQGFDERFGARELRRTIRKHLEFPLADFLLSIENDSDIGVEAAVLLANLDQNKIIFERKHT